MLKAYLYRFDRESDPYCPCYNVNEDAKYVFFECQRFVTERNEVKEKVGVSINPGNVTHMYAYVCYFTKSVIRELERQKDIRGRNK